MFCFRSHVEATEAYSRICSLYRRRCPLSCKHSRMIVREILKFGDFGTLDIGRPGHLPDSHLDALQREIEKKTVDV
ncbi:hypothetical protein M514_06063 [Trichuris suis]|uniref:Uncharacterized protein n=1 Tax=Trichuris suis TaxID=68888 RepID=A0A085M7F3_9BILA|nr:hypothetical protein M513_06063 [Trichuris suis]KFD70701.1 hypothetical protein M514_06063 [Trichuris suis]